MRQRLLLVAGWVLAAVGTSVVASAAVAATGGQVTDRALRPLTAAEVAALPGGYFEVLSESLASGDSSNKDIREPGESDTPGSTKPSPAGAEGALFFGIDHDLDDNGSFLVLGPDGPQAVLTDLLDVVEPDPVSVLEILRTDSRIEHVEGGSVSLATSADLVTLLWATPTLGWSINIEFLSGSQIIVLFTDDTVTWTVNAKVVDGLIDVATQQTGVT